MHPEIIKDQPGICDICGMPLVKAETFGFIAAEPRVLPLVIPASAPLITGKRAIVYVQNKDDPSRFSGREVTLGPRAGDVYLVRDGLQEGELVVVRGNFKIDSALQIMAKPSMMSHEGSTSTKKQAPPHLRHKTEGSSSSNQSPNEGSHHH